MPRDECLQEIIDVEVLIDQAGHAYRGYVVEEGEIEIVVVRPDGVVGAIVRGAAGLERYFEGVFRKKRACLPRRMQGKFNEVSGRVFW